jgi:hypothetical protein
MFLIAPGGLSGTSGGKQGQGVIVGPGSGTGQRPVGTKAAPKTFVKTPRAYQALPVDITPFVVNPTPPAPSPVDIPNVTDYQPFRKGNVLSPDVTRVDAGTGEGPYNPSDPLWKVTQKQVRQASDYLNRKYGVSPTPTPIIDIAPIQQPLTATSTGGGGGGGAAADDTSGDQPVGFWAALPTAGKVALIGGGLAVVGFIVYRMTRGGGTGPRSKSRLS